MRVWLLRHPRPLVAPGVCYGRLDVEVGDGFAMPAIERPPRRVVSSPAARALALARRFGAPVRTDPRWHELDFGRWEGVPWTRIARTESDPWAADPWSVAPPGGETFAALHARVGAALAVLGEGDLVVTHAGPLRAARMIAEGLSFEAAFRWPVPYAEPVPLDLEPAR